ncbi:MAG: protein-L-isoaspartate O-methyltransferase [Pseudomonadota bacterium]
MNLEQARENMIEQQVRTWEVLDSRVLSVMREVPREDFVPARHRKLAFSDLRIPIGHEQIMMKPIEQGRALQSLNLEGHEHVLEVGSGSGYLTACLAQLAAQVTSIERIEALAELAKSNLTEHLDGKIALQQGDVLSAEFPAQGFDVIVVPASVASVPECFSRWLKTDGRVFIVRGQSPAMEAMLLTRTADGRWREESLFDTDLPRLIGAEDAPIFNF